MNMEICWHRGILQQTIPFELRELVSGSFQWHLVLALIAELTSHRCYLYCLFSTVVWSFPQMRLTLSDYFFFFLNPVFQENTLFVFVLGKECQNPGKTILRYFCQRSQPDQSQLCLQLISFPTQNAQGLLWSWISSSLLSIPSFPMTFQSDTDAVLSAPLI